MRTLINNSQWRSHLQTLDRSGVRESEQIFNLVRSRSRDEVDNAIELYLALKAIDHIPNPQQYFYQILKEGWGDRSLMDIMRDPDRKAERNAIFNIWLDYSKKFGKWDEYQDIDGSRHVFKEGQEPLEKFILVWNRGWNLEYFRRLDRKDART